MVNHDVDTVAVRLKRGFGFQTEAEVAQYNNGSLIGEYREAAARDGGYVWSAQPGSYYKMGGSITKNTKVHIEVIKDGSNRSKIHVTNWTIKGATFNEEKSMANVRRIANGG